MPAAKRKLYIEQGTDWSETFTIEDSEGVTIDLTGYSIAGHVRLRETKTESLAFAFTFSIDESDNSITVSVAKATTTALTLGEKATQRASTFWYDYELTAPTGDVERIQEGLLILYREITR